jgi:hypothetical protein
MQVSIQDLWNTVDPNTIPKPTFETLEGRVKVNDNLVLNFDDIYIDDDENNLARMNGVTPSHIEDLRLSFSNAVDLNELPPCVMRRRGGVKPYELVYGYGRTMALRELGQKKWFFSHIEADEPTIIDVKLIENEPKLPKLNSSEQDIKNALVYQIEKKYLKNDEDLIRKKLNQVCANRKKQSKDRILQWVLEDSNTPQKYAFYNKSKAQLWIDNHSKEEWVIGGVDVPRNQHGFLVKEGYQYRFVMNAINEYAETGRHSYCIAHMGAPSGNSTIPQKRIKFRQELDYLLNNLRLCGMDTNFIHIAGALPQERNIDNWKSLVKI